MKLKLHPHNPDEEVKNRALRAVEAITKEYRAVEDPGVRPSTPIEKGRVQTRSKNFR